MQILEARSQAVGNNGRTNPDSTLVAVAAISSGMVVSLFADRLLRSIGRISLGPAPACDIDGNGVRPRLATRQKLCVALYDTGGTG
ncbi:hypothetical protein HNP32_002962 [Brevundimonas bullata]|jgi:hypothetical protein|uniref:Uncharacterized protein n=1 Tax=Brevundimonas bullata TaxID=13160 RepID=A0A7W7IRI2_9CAUL|nr:hypothetical protein [Brevundimonas bullata]MBB4799206.1 hypothetical protein [Brevundimonas bullata]MBB6384100.1 hypothetical protein [Brevundimonas bullata]